MAVLMTALLMAPKAARAHPGAGIVVDAAGNVYFTDTGRGVWKVDGNGRLTEIHSRTYHWMALDRRGDFARSASLGQFDGGTFERVTREGAVPAILISSDYPIAVGMDGALYYVPYRPEGPRQLIRRTAKGHRVVFATLPPSTGEKPMQWVNGIAAAHDGSLYVSDDDAVHRIDVKGSVSTVSAPVGVSDCSDPLPGTPKLPYLRGLAVAQDGAIYAAATGCRAVITISRQGRVGTVLRSERPWSPTGVALFGGDVYVLEYRHTQGDNSAEWIPRVRVVTADGRIRTLVTVNRTLR